MAHTIPTLMMVNLSKAWGGGEKWFMTVGQELQKKGFHVVMVCYPDSVLHQRLKQTELPYEVSAIRFLSLLNPFKVGKGLSILKKHSPDFLMTNASHELKTFGLLAKWSGVPNIIFRRGVSYALKDNFLNRWYMGQVATAFLANSQATFAAVTERFPVFLHKNHLQLNNGIRVADWTAQKEQQVPFQIAMSARLSPEKGVARAISVMQAVCKELPQARLHIFGTGPEEANLKTRAKEVGLEQEIVFHGFVKDIQEALSRCVLFMFTPIKGEGTSIALIEAMAMELPCVVFDAPAMSEVVADGETGYVIPDGDIAAMGRQMVALLQDKDLLEKMGKKGRKRAESFFNLPTSVIDPLADWLKGMRKEDHD